MAKLVWDQIGEKLFETGVDHGVLYPGANYSGGVVWNGLTAVTESPTGAEATPQYADNIKYLNLISAEEYGATIEAFTYPEEFGLCDGSAELAQGVYIGQQARKPFGFSFRSMIGNDTDGQNHGYKIHLIYGALASPSERNYTTINDSPEASAMSWEITTTPVPVTGFKPTSTVIVDSTKTDAVKLAAFETILYGTTEEEPRMPLPDEVATLLGVTAG